MRRKVAVVVHPDIPSLQPVGNAFGPFDITAPDRRAETHICVVRPGDDILFVPPLQHGKDGPKGLLCHDARVLWRVVDDGQGHKVPSALVQVPQRPTHRRLQAMPGNFPVQILDARKLSSILDWARKGFGVASAACAKTSGKGDQLLHEVVVDGLVDIQALDVHADLPRVEKGKRADLGHNLCEIGILAHDGGVVAAQLQREALECGRTALHDLLPRRAGPCEADLGDARVRGQAGTEVVVPAEDLDDTAGEDSRGELAQFQRCVRREGRWFPDKRVSGEQGGVELAETEENGKVPGDDADPDAEGRVPKGCAALGGSASPPPPGVARTHLFGVLENLLGDAQLRRHSNVREC